MMTCACYISACTCPYLVIGCAESTKRCTFPGHLDPVDRLLESCCFRPYFLSAPLFMPAPPSPHLPPLPLSHAPSHCSPASPYLPLAPLLRARLQRGGTPLHEAAYYGHVEVVRLLLGAGASAEAITAVRASGEGGGGGGARSRELLPFVRYCRSRRGRERQSCCYTRMVDSLYFAIGSAGIVNMHTFPDHPNAMHGMSARCCFCPDFPSTLLIMPASPLPPVLILPLSHAPSPAPHPNAPPHSSTHLLPLCCSRYCRGAARLYTGQLSMGT
jgi:hypothetical protein